MRAVLQRVRSGSVTIDGEVVGSIGAGLVILLGAGKNDTDADTRYLAEKTVNLRVFEDDGGKMNRSLIDIRGEALVVSQFTLYANSTKGRRPSFTDAALPEIAEQMYVHYIKLLTNSGIKVSSGEFGADMLVNIANDGPVTIILDTDEMMNK